MNASPLTQHLGLFCGFHKRLLGFLNRGCRWICNSTVADRIGCLQLGTNGPFAHVCQGSLYIAYSGLHAGGGIADCDGLESVHRSNLARFGGSARTPVNSGDIGHG